MSDNEYTWREAVADAHTAAAEAFAYCVADPDCDPEDGAYDAAHEFADGSAWVIYYHRAAALWMDSREVQDAEDQATEGLGASDGIDTRISLCVYHALVDAFVEKWEELYAEAQATEELTA
jgi:hypothetical protein